jgi:hypothetical protein
MKRFFLVVTLLVSFLSGDTASAALFYEFNPDYSQSLLVATSETVSELFLPLNDYLGAFDFWVSNANTAGDATFTLYNPSGGVIAERIVAVPAINDTAGGTRLKVNLPSQISVIGTSAYRVRIATTVPTFRLYYADATRLLPHNGVPVPAYTGGLARIGDTDMGYSFKFALYENSESTPPQLTNVTITHQSPTQATMTFSANEPVDRRLQYGSTVLNWNNEYSSCAPTIQSCTMLLAVAPATTYQYTLTVRDVWGNQTVATGTFTSLSDGQTPTPTPSASPSPSTSPTGTPTPTVTPSTTPDVVAPIITNARLVSSTPQTATFAWTTNEAANSSVVVQLLPDLINVGNNNDATLELEHAITVDSLTPDTFLRASITSRDSSGNASIAIVEFTTPVQTPLPSNPSSPAPSAPPTATPSSTPLTTSDEDDPSISWTPPANETASTSYRIDIFDANNNLIKTITVPAGQYQAALGKLPKGEHRIIIYAATNGVFEKVATPTRVSVQSGAKKSVLERIVIALPYILGGVVVLIFFAVGILKLRKPKTPIPPPVSPVTTPYSSALPPTSDRQ